MKAADQPSCGQCEVADWLATAGAYPHPVEEVRRIETHCSRVYLAGAFAYKLKKPVRFDFLDFSTAALREAACREELRLNRRLAPATYLDVLPIVREPAGGLRLGGLGPGAAVDWVVQMQRLPDERMLDVLLRAGQLTREHVDCLAARLCSFYATLPPASLSPKGYRARLREHVQGNLQQLRDASLALDHDVVRRVHAFQLAQLALAPRQFDVRVRAGRVVEGHGDLRPEHICLTAPPEIFDCLEFNRELRELDVADELMFLAEECDSLGGGWVGQRVWQIYEERNQDHVPPVLLDFYRAYRACVRAKVAALRADQLEGDLRETALCEARQRLEAADRYSAPWQHALVLAVGGPAGTGKTTLSQALAEQLGLEHLRTDVVRRELYTEAGPAHIDEGIYGAEARARVYDELLHRAGNLCSRKLGVVLDASFSSLPWLRAAEELARGDSENFLAIECFCSPETAENRIAQRLALKEDASDARPELHRVQRTRWTSWPAAIRQLRIDTEQPLEEQVEQVFSTLREPPTD